MVQLQRDANERADVHRFDNNDNPAIGGEHGRVDHDDVRRGSQRADKPERAVQDCRRRIRMTPRTTARRSPNLAITTLAYDPLNLA